MVDVEEPVEGVDESVGVLGADEVSVVVGGTGSVTIGVDDGVDGVHTVRLAGVPTVVA